MSESERTLVALLRAYIAGDRTARLALGDWLEERGDARAEVVRAAEVGWGAVAWALFVERHPYWMQERGPMRPHRRLDNYQHAELSRIRWNIDCVLAGSDAPADVKFAVRGGLRGWLAGLFPEVADSLSDA
jgi:uncharacterized protein (TIGR02996 family)